MTKNLQGKLRQQLQVLPADEQRRVLDFARALALSRPQCVAGKDLLRFAGTIPSEDLKLINTAIEEGCEQVDVNGW